MVNIDPREPGDDVYEQYTIKKTYQLADAGAAVKGNLYSFDAAGKLIPVTAVGGAVSLHKGCVQATVSVPAATPGKLVQCHVGGSWIIMLAGAAMTTQSRVVVSASGTTVSPNKTGLITTSTSVAYVLGTIHEILSQTTEGVVKTLAAINDKIVVQLGVSG